MRVQRAGTVKEAIGRVEAGELDLVVTDLKLPDGTGLDVIGAIRARRPGLPIIMITSYSSMESAIVALRAGADDYVIKPFNNDEFLRAVARALHKRRMAPLTRRGAAARDRGVHPRGDRALPGLVQRDRARAHARHRPQGAVDAPPPMGIEAQPKKRFLEKQAACIPRALLLSKWFLRGGDADMAEPKPAAAPRARRSPFRSWWTR